MNRTCFSQNTPELASSTQLNLHEQNQHADSTRPTKRNLFTITVSPRELLILIFSLICFAGYSQNIQDTLKQINKYQPQLEKDTANGRLKFIQDSIFAREKFVRDSILHHQQMKDSVTFLQGELQTLLEAVQWTVNEDIISHTEKINLIGDSALGNYIYYKLLFTPYEPYVPWKGQLDLNAKGIRFNVDKNSKKIQSIQSPFLNCSFKYFNQGKILIIQEDFNFQNTSYGKFYKIPIDTIFYDSNKRIVKIKRYVQFYKQELNYQKGAFLFTNLIQVKQFQYNSDNQMYKFELVKFKDRYNAYDSNDVTYLTNFTLTKQGNNYQITRKNRPENSYSDGTFSIDLNEQYVITCIAFQNIANTQKWQRFIVLNKDGNVGCYIDKNEGIKSFSTCMEYHNEAGAKYPVEIISTSFEKGGIDMFQKNITTQKSRSRDKITLEWSPWK
jgi:hypothetical protein